MLEMRNMDIFKELHFRASAGVASHTDDWFDQEPNPRPYIPVKPNFLALKLEPFDGDCTKWPEFSAIFKALIHDVVQTAYQRLVYLRMYFKTKIHSRIAGLLTQPSHYQDAL